MFSLFPSSSALNFQWFLFFPLGITSQSGLACSEIGSAGSRYNPGFQKSRGTCRRCFFFFGAVNWIWWSWWRGVLEECHPAKVTCAYFQPIFLLCCNFCFSDTKPPLHVCAAWWMGAISLRSDCFNMAYLLLWGMSLPVWDRSTLCTPMF